MESLSFLAFEPDFSSPEVMIAYDELPLWSAMFGLLLLDNVPLAGVRSALDVGCGAGFPLIELAERLGPAADVHGIDPWTAGLKRAAEKIDRFRIGRCQQGAQQHFGPLLSTIDAAGGDHGRAPQPQRTEPTALVVGGHLFDRYPAFRPAPAAAFVLSVVRAPAPGVATLEGGGWIASGPVGPDQRPLPVRC